MAEREEQVQEEQKLRGRAGALAAYKAANPDLQEDPDDDVLYDFHSDRYSDLEGRHNDLEGRHNELNGANSRLSEQVSKDPRLAAVLSMIAGENPKSFPYAVASIYGKEPFDLEGDALEEYESGYQENLKREEEGKKLKGQQDENIKKYESSMSQYAKDKGLTDEQTLEIHKGILQLANDLNMGIVSGGLIDLVYKGLNYEKDMQEAVDTGFAQGRSDVIDAKLKKPEDRSVPDLGNGTGDGKNIPRRTKGGLRFPGE